MIIEPHHNAAIPRKIAQKAPAAGKVSDAFRIKPLPLQWFRAVGSAISAAVPVLIGALAGHMEYGLCASIGGFAFLYVSNETYRQRALKLLFVALGLALSFGLGALTGTTPWLMVLLFGLIGAAAVFCFGVFQVAGPSAMFFILTFSVGTSLPFDLSAVPVRTGFVLAGGALAWVVGMAGWLLRPHHPEMKAVAGAYASLARLVESMGTEHQNEAQHQAAVALQNAAKAVSGGELRWRRSYEPTQRLLLLSRKANEIYLTVSEMLLQHQTGDKEMASALLGMAAGIRNPGRIETPHVDGASAEAEGLAGRLAVQVGQARNLLGGTEAAVDRPLEPDNRLRLMLSGAFNRHSTLLGTACRYGLTIAVAAAVAYGFGFHRSYWVPLSCAAVMLGTTAIGTVHRALQRTAGTIVGLFVGGVLLSLKPEGVYVALAMAVLQFIVELIYLRNYALAVIFITPSALLIAESSHPETAMSYFMSARVVDILVGSAIGLAGVLLLWRRASSSRLPGAIADAVRKEGALLGQILSGGRPEAELVSPAELETLLLRVRMLYNAALAEPMRRRERISLWWPAVAELQHFGYVLIAAAEKGLERKETPETLGRLEQLVEEMSQAVRRSESPAPIKVPELSSSPSLRDELIELHNALQVGEGAAPLK
ncbi:MULTISPECIES: FUSC family protein [Paenibacillus]|uniref:Membrane protein YvaC n=1 Tax=Paenibacillus albilobatus TaxID=2716884 RepID=A0A919XHJ9_9BACL|nr:MULTISPECIES: FUSC family protein [Paenibacillus]GIO32976.1 putative membrane protein YvaC [Paenibacillus albilobatus]